MSLGTSDADYTKLKKIIEAVPEVEYICVDVANGYSEHFVQFLRDVRKDFPNHTIIVSPNCVHDRPHLPTCYIQQCNTVSLLLVMKQSITSFTHLARLGP